MARLGRQQPLRFRLVRPHAMPPAMKVGTVTGAFTFAGATEGIAPTSTGTVLRFADVTASDTLAPTYTAVASTGATTSIAGGVLIPPTDARFSYRAAGGYAYGTGFPLTTLFAASNRYDNSWGTPPIDSVEWNHTGLEFEILLYASNITVAALQIKIDGQRSSALPILFSSLGATAGGRFKYKITFPTSATRKITYEASYGPFGGVFVDGSNAISACTPELVRMLFQGDSITGSSAENTGAPLGTYVFKLANYLQVDPWNIAIGGTGYVNAGTSVILQGRLADTVNWAPNVVQIWAGYNDNLLSQATISTNANQYYSDTKAALPTAEIYVIGCYSTTATPGASLVNTDNTLKAAALAQGLPFASPQTGDIYNGAGTWLGNVGALWVDAAAVAAYIGSDNTHPNDAGHAQIATWLRSVYQIISAPAPSMGTVTGAVQFDGTAAGVAPVNNGTASGAFAFDGSAVTGAAPVITRFRNNCEGAVAPGTNWTSSNQGASGDPLTITNTGGTIQTTTTAGEVIHETKSVKLTPSGATTQRLSWALANTPSGNGRCYYRLSAPPSADASLVILQGSGGQCAQAKLSATNSRIRMENAAGTTPTGGSPATPLTFPGVYGFDLICTPGTSTADGVGRLVVYNEDGTVFADTGDIVSNFFRTGVLQDIRFGVTVNYPVIADSFTGSDAYLLSGPYGSGPAATGAITWAGSAAGPVSTGGPASGAFSFVGAATGTHIVLLQQVVNQTGAATSVPTTVATTTAGSALVLVIANGTGATNPVSAVTDNAGNTWQLGAAGYFSGSNTRIEIWYALNTASTTQVTVTKGSAAVCAIDITEWAGVALSGALDQAVGGGVASNTSQSAGPVTTTNANDLLIGGISYPGTSITTTMNTAGFTSLTDLANTQRGRAAYAIVAATGTYSVNWTLSAAANAGNAMVALKSAAVSNGLGTVSGAFSFVGASSGAAALSGAATGDVTWAGTVSGAITTSGTAAGQITWAGTSSGTTLRAGVATGDVTWAGTAAGSSTAGGPASGAFTFVGAASGAATLQGSATGAISWVGSASGSRTSAGSASGTVTDVGAAVGSSALQGSASGAIVWAGSAAGVAPIVGVNNGTASGALAWVGTVSGARTSSGPSSGAITWAGTVAGTTTMSGAATGSMTWVGTAAGVRAPVGTASGAMSWVGSAVGVTNPIGTVAGAITWTGSSAGAIGHAGTAVGAVNWTATGTGAIITSGGAAGQLTWDSQAAGFIDTSGATTGLVIWTGAVAGQFLANSDVVGTIVWAGHGVGATITFGTVIGGVEWSGLVEGHAGLPRIIVPPIVSIGGPREHGPTVGSPSVRQHSPTVGPPRVKITVGSPFAVSRG